MIGIMCVSAMISSCCASARQIKGSFTDENNMTCSFRISLFKAASGEGYVVEFQRRSGDSIAFNTLFSRVSTQMEEPAADSKPSDLGSAVSIPFWMSTM